MKSIEQYEAVIKKTSKVSVLIYTLPISVIVILLHASNVESTYILEFLIIYAIGAISHALAYGFSAINSQIHFFNSNKKNKN
jgi:hypothetical protein